MFPAIAKRIAAGARRLSAVASFVKLLRREDGHVAIEFALVAAPFLALMFAILEAALIFLASQTLETAAQNSGRLILTGQAQNKGYNMASFQQAVCPTLASFFTCSNLLIDVRTAADFSSVDTTLPIQNGNVQNNFTFTPGTPGDIVIVRLMYPWQTYVSLLGFANSISNLSGNSRLLMATAAFRNEPYQPTP